MYNLFFSDFDETFIFMDRFSKNPQMSNLIECPSRGGQVVPWGMTEISKLIVAFRIFFESVYNLRLGDENLNL
jgi:hypothetical protein